MSTVKQKYADILQVSYTGIKKHPPMQQEKRAAQFAPFSALTGYEEAIAETERITERKIEFDESQKALINEALEVLEAKLRYMHPKIRVTYFVADKKKAGGVYHTDEVIVKKLKTTERKLLTENGMVILLDDLAGLELLPESGKN